MLNQNKKSHRQLCIIQASFIISIKHTHLTMNQHQMEWAVLLGA